MNILCIGRCFPASGFFKERDHRLSLIATKADFVQAEYEFDYDKVFISKEINNDSVVEIVAAWNSEQAIDAVCCYNDKYFDLVIQLVERFNIRSILSKDAVANTDNKSRTRDILVQNGIPSAQYAIVNDEQAAHDFLDNVSQLAILKPLAASASIGVSRVASHDDVSQAIVALEQQGQGFPALMESFLEGDEFSVESFSENGEHRILAITKKYKYDNTFIEQGHAMHAELDTETETQVIDYIVKVLSALGIENGPAHSEIILTSEGPVLVESHTRVGGDLIHEIIELATGVDVLTCSARQILGESVLKEIPEHLPKKQSAAVWFAFPNVTAETTVEAYKGNTKAEELDGIHTLRLMKPAGSKVVPARNSFDRLAVAVATGDSLQAALTKAQAAMSQLQPQYTK
ncbi:ATP-grasp domain-containing protein [Paraneptunicella aestuarii]|uniref:ATP-grasp domain-containing protein n=1 Tax=Paraneptunicella aestuarii TaxID=2831148 RepID=UPI001E365E4B|nr:ATP-grasp domain-containing protein [Paraneptunicella aestuarii]UAA38011.1 ATP-grasp domain-containing protein [Paraneptunicella aestuarii]